MRICLYIDEDSMRRGLVRALRTRHVDVLTPLDVQMIERSDPEHLEYATSQGRVLCSYNTRDFFRLHQTWLGAGKSHSGIILVRQQEYSVGEQMRRILRLISVLSAEEMRDRVEFLSAWK